MKELQVYLESGIIEAYCLGQLDSAEMREVERMAKQFPVLRAEIDRTKSTLRHLSIETPALRSRKQHIMHTIQQLQLEQEMSLDHLPLLNPYSNHQAWLAVVRDLQPTERMGSIQFRVLQEKPNLLQTLIWMEDLLEEDGHDPDNFQESFLILQGECACQLGSETVRLGAGGYVAIPPNTPHTIRNLHPGRPLLGIMQRYLAAA